MHTVLRASTEGAFAGLQHLELEVFLVEEMVAVGADGDGQVHLQIMLDLYLKCR